MNAAARRCAEAIRRVGGEAVLVRGELRDTFPASLQARKASEPDAGPLGCGMARYYTLYMPRGTAGERVEAGDTVLFHDGRYTVCRVENMIIGDEAAYRWAVVRRQAPEG